jgi:hypothetical protein
MNSQYSQVAERAAHRCEYCRAPEAIFNFPFEVEHIVPTSKRGADDAANLALACRSCNLFKLDHLAGIDLDTNQEAGLFNPRRDSWHEHFNVEPDSAKIRGKTAAGRATIERLRMNSPLQVPARAAWMRLGLLPP